MMTDQHYDLFFNGQTLAGHSIEAVMQTLKESLKLSDAYLDTLFSGNEVRLKKQVDKATAVKFQQAFKAAGAKLIVKLHTAEPPSPAPQEPVTHQSERPAAQSIITAPSITSHQPNLAAPDQTPDWEIAAPGAILVEPKQEQPLTTFDLNHLSLAAPGALLTPPEFEPPEPIIDISHLELANNDGDIKTLETEKTAVQVDISHLSLE